MSLDPIEQARRLLATEHHPECDGYSPCCDAWMAWDDGPEVVAALAAEVNKARGLLGCLRAVLFARESTRLGVAEEVDAYLGPIVAPLDALTQAAQLDGQYAPPANQN